MVFLIHFRYISILKKQQMT